MERGGGRTILANKHIANTLSGKMYLGGRTHINISNLGSWTIGTGSIETQNRGHIEPCRGEEKRTWPWGHLHQHFVLQITGHFHVWQGWMACKYSATLRLPVPSAGVQVHSFSCYLTNEGLLSFKGACYQGWETVSTVMPSVSPSSAFLC